MKKLQLVFILLFIGIVLAIPLMFLDTIYGNPIRSWLMEKATKDHLYSVGYTSDDILEIEAFYSMKKDNGMKRTRAYVIFKDEREEKYVYIEYDKDGDIQQSCNHYNKETDAYESNYNENRKHMVKDCVVTVFSAI